MPSVNTRKSTSSWQHLHPLLHSRYGVPEESMKRLTAHPRKEPPRPTSASRSCPTWPLERRSLSFSYVLVLPPRLADHLWTMTSSRRADAQRTLHKQGPDDDSEKSLSATIGGQGLPRLAPGAMFSYVFCFDLSLSLRFLSSSPDRLPGFPFSCAFQRKC